MSDILVILLIIITLFSTLLIIPLNTSLFNRKIHDFINKSKIGELLVLLFYIGLIFGIAIAAAESHLISIGVTSPFPWEALEFAIYEEKGIGNVFLSMIDNLLYLLWIFFLPAHMLAWSKYQKEGKRPLYYYAINIVLGIATVVSDLPFPISAYF